MRTAIIGGGIAGLAAAYELEQARQGWLQVEYTLLNRATGWRLPVFGERGRRGAGAWAGSFLTEKPAAAELCRELGWPANVTPSNDADRKTCIVVRNRLFGYPTGSCSWYPPS